MRSTSTSTQDPSEQLQLTVKQLQCTIQSLIESIKVANLPVTGIMRLPQVLAVLPLSKAGWYKGIKEGIYPQPINLGPRAVGWKAEDVLALAAKFAAEGWKPNTDERRVQGRKAHAEKQRRAKLAA